MPVEHVIEISRSAIGMVLFISAPVLIVGAVVSLVTGALQAVTQIQDSTLNVIPRLVVILLTLFTLLPWSLSRLVEYSSDLIRSIPSFL